MNGWNNGLPLCILGAGQIGTEIARQGILSGARRVHLHTHTAVELSIARATLGSLVAEHDVTLSDSHGDLFVGGLDRYDRMGEVLNQLSGALVVDSTNSATTLALESPEEPTIQRAFRACQAWTESLRRGFSEGRIERFVKVSTTGLGGLGLDIRFTHGDEPEALLSPGLWLKTAISGMQHQMLWALARTVPGRVFAIVPAACVGFERLETEPVADGSRVVVYAGENCAYTAEELACLTGTGQMGVISKEEVARAALEVALGTNPDRDILSALQAASLHGTEDGRRVSYRVRADLAEARQSVRVGSIATGNLGPVISILLLEAALVAQARRQLGHITPTSTEDLMKAIVEASEAEHIARLASDQSVILKRSPHSVLLYRAGQEVGALDATKIAKWNKAFSLTGESAGLADDIGEVAARFISLYPEHTQLRTTSTAPRTHEGLRLAHEDCAPNLLEIERS